MQRSRCASMDHTRITLQKSINCGFINLLQVKLRDLEPLAEPGDRIHLHWNRRRQKALSLNTSQIGIKMTGQWPHAKPVEKTRINESLHLPNMAIPGHSRLCRIVYGCLPARYAASQRIR